MNTKLPFGLFCQQIPWLKELAKQDQEQIFLQLQPHHVEKNYPFLWSAFDHHQIHIIVQGRVRIFYWHPRTGRTVNLEILGPGDILPIAKLLMPNDPQPIEYEYESLESVFTFSAPLSTWNQWFDQIPTLSRIVMALASRRITELAQKVEEISVHSLEERILNLLIRDRQLQEQRGFSRLEGLTQTIIAEQIGTSRVPFSRELKTLEKHHKIVRLKRVEGITLLENRG